MKIRRRRGPSFSRGLSAPTATIAAQVLLRRARLAAVRGDHRVARVLPDAHRGGHLRPRTRAAWRQQLGPVATLVDLGAGNCEKAAAPVRRRSPCSATWRWTSRPSYLRDSLEILQRQHPALDMLGVGLDFSQTLALPDEVGDGPRTPVLPGLEHRQLHAGRGAGLPAAGARRLRRRRAADRRRPGQAGCGARARLRRSAGRHRRLQPQPAAAPQSRWSAPTSTLPTGATSPSSTAPSRASRCTSRRVRDVDGALARRRPPLRRMASACTPRIPTSGGPTTLPRCSRAPAFRGCSTGPTSAAGSPSSWRFA